MDEHPRRTIGLRHLGMVLGVGVIAIGLARLDLSRSFATLRAAGPWAALSLLPFVFISGIDSLAWSLAARRCKARPFGFLRCRLGLEAIALTVPGSAIAADGVAPSVLHRFAGLEGADAVSAVLVKKWGIVTGHALVLGCAAIVGSGFASRVRNTDGLGVDPGIVLVVACACGAGASFAISAGLRAGVARRAVSMLARVPWHTARQAFSGLIGAGARADDGVRLFFASGRRLPAALALTSMAVWLAESAELYVFFDLLGAAPRFADVLALEALVGVARVAAFFVPGGLGVQELGYVTLAELAVGSPSAGLGAATVILRRARDAVWIVIGYVLLSRFGRERATP